MPSPCWSCHVIGLLGLSRALAGGNAPSSPATQARAKSGELKYLDAAQAYFDDVAHYKEISALSSYTHPAIWGEKKVGGDEDGGRAAEQTDASGHRTFNSLNALKRHLQQLHKLQFCEICLEGRKVWVIACGQKLPLLLSMQQRGRWFGPEAPDCRALTQNAGLHFRAAAVRPHAAGSPHEERGRGGADGGERVQGAPRVQACQGVAGRC